MTQSFAITIAIVIVAIALVTRFSSLSSVRKVSRRWLLGGIILAVLVGLGIWWFVHREPKEENESTSSTTYTTPPTTSTIPEYPTSGERFATKEKPVRVWLDPRKTHTRGSGPAHYVFEDHPTTTFDDYFDGRRDKEWWNYPAGWYLVTPIKGGEIFFRWWQ